jgi:phage gp46-like protein
MADASLDASRDLETAVILSLFTDSQADADDVLPDRSRDRRGWWGDAGAPVPLGSRLWLLSREKTTPATRLRAIQYANDALAWMIEDGVADQLDVDAAYAAGTPTRLDLTITIIREGETLFSRRFDPFWQEIAA